LAYRDIKVVRDALGEFPDAEIRRPQVENRR